MPIPIVLERGPKSRRFVAYSVDWPGWSRGAKTPEAAVETLEAYRDRYRRIAELAGLASEFDAAGPLEVAEERVGTPSVDFWAISFSASATEQDLLAPEVLERRLALLQAAWAFFDATAARVSAEMAKGPRGGGRERDEIIRHVIRVESLDFAHNLGMQIEEDDVPLAPAARRQFRDAYLELIREYNAGRAARPMRSRTIAFLIRHTAFHTLDHAWEMEDKDLSGRR
jgi:hypothetical protein